MNDTINVDLYNQVIEDYKETKSVRKTAKNCHTSMVTAQRILITAGLWSSKSSQQVQELFDQGMTADQIAEELNITKDAVYTYMPYSRGNYGVKQTEDSQYSRDYRERMETAAEGMHQETAPSEISVMPGGFTNLRFDRDATKDLTGFAMQDAVFGDTYYNTPRK